MVTETNTFTLLSYGIELVTVELGDHETLSKVSFVKDGVTNEYTFPGITANKVTQTVTVEYFKHYRDSQGNLLQDVEVINKRFEATAHNDISYFYYLPTSSHPTLGVMLEKMQINGLLIELFGPEVYCYSPLDGTFLQPTDVVE